MLRRASYNNAFLLVVKRLWSLVPERPKVGDFVLSGKLFFEVLVTTLQFGICYRLFACSITPRSRCSSDAITWAEEAEQRS